MTISSSVLTTTDINGGTIDGVSINTSDITVGTDKTLDVQAGTLIFANNQISGDKVEGGTINATTINTSPQQRVILRMLILLPLTQKI